MVKSYKTLMGIVAVGLAFTSIELVDVDVGAGPEAPVAMTAEDGKTYSVAPRETLGAAMVRAAVEEQEQGHCVPEPMENKPPDTVGCTCYEQTDCKGNESRQCKRHCRRDLCECCGI